jgi:hypothetical protein
VGVLLARKRRDLFAGLAEAALHYAEAGAESDADFEAARERLRKAAMRWAASQPALTNEALGIVREVSTPRPKPGATQLPLF